MLTKTIDHSIYNKKFAEYLGYIYVPCTDKSVILPGWRHRDAIILTKKSEGIIRSNQWLCRSHNDLKFHCSWDWIMYLWKTIKSDPDINISPFQSEIMMSLFHHDIDCLYYYMFKALHSKV